MPSEQEGIVGLLGLDRDAFKLYDVYERFIARFYSHHLSDWVVSRHQKLTWPTEDASVYLPTMYPDLTLQHKASGQLVLLDTKFTAKILDLGMYDKPTFSSHHLYQIYAYLKSQEHRSEHHTTSTGVLLYPTVKHELSETVTIQGHAIRWETVDLSRPWDQIEEELLAIPNAILVQLAT